MISLLLAGCVPPDAAPPEPPSEPGVEVVANPYDPLSALLRLPEPADVSATWSTGTLPHTAAGPTELLLQGLPPGQDVDVDVVVDGLSERHVVTTPALGPGFPVGVATGALELDGWLCSNGRDLDAEARSVLFCSDTDGTPRFSREHPDGSRVFAWVATDDGVLAVTATEFVRLDRVGREVRRFVPEDLSGRYAHGRLDDHELAVLEAGPYAGAWLLLTGALEQVAGEPYRGAGIVVLEPEGAVLWDWSAHGEPGDGVSIDPLLPYSRLGPAGLTLDWLHANAVRPLLDPDGTQAFLLSLRSQDWLVRVEPDGSIGWRLGHEGDFTLVDLEGTPLPDTEWFSHQHDPHVIAHDGVRTELVLFDNGNDRPGGEPFFSRAVRLLVDVDAGTATLLWSWSEPGFYADKQGTALPVGDDVLVLDPNGPRVMWTGTEPYELLWPSQVSMYRLRMMDPGTLTTW